MFAVAVRTYERPEIFHTHTLRILREQGLLEELTVFVGSDLQPYQTQDPDLRYVQVPKGGANAIRAICDYYPPGTRILFLDDDLQSYYGPKPLRELTEEGFKRADVWGFGFITNKFWLQTAKEWQPRYATLAGCAFAAVASPLIPTTESHCDDLQRTVQLFRAGIVPYVWSKAGFKTKYAKNPAGLQHERTNTLAVCERLFPTLQPYVRDIHQQPCGLYAIRIAPAQTIKRLLKECQNPSQNPSAGAQC